MSRRILGALVVAPLMWASVGGAATVSCPNTSSTSDREFSVTTSGTATCLLSGNGNSLNGVDDPLNKSPFNYVTLDAAANTTVGLLDGTLTFNSLGATSGSFSFTAPAGYTNFVVGFQSTTAGGVKPHYAALLLPGGVTSGTWFISSGETPLGTVVDAILYAQPVPLPAAAWLLLSGLLGLGVVARRRAQ